MPSDRVCPACNGTGRAAIPEPLAPAYYFECWKDAGHYLFGSKGRTVYHEEKRLLPQALQTPDGTLAPARRDPAGNIREEAAQGVAALHHIDGWTALSFWDRSVDHRGGSNSTFILRGVHSFEEAESLARKAFPQVWARFTFKVVFGFDAKTAVETES